MTVINFPHVLRITNILGWWIVALYKIVYVVWVLIQQTQTICIIFVQRRPNVVDVGPTLYKCYTNVLCLLCSNSLSATLSSVGLRVNSPGLLLLTSHVSSIWHFIFAKLIFLWWLYSNKILSSNVNWFVNCHPLIISWRPPFLMHNRCSLKVTVSKKCCIDYNITRSIFQINFR